MRSIKLYILAAALIIMLPVFTKAQDKSLNEVFTAYFTVKNDLADDNYTSAKAHSADLATAIKAVVADKIPAEQLPALKKIQVSTIRMGEAKDVDTQRDYFAILSENMITLAKAVKTNAVPIYQQYCPMKKLNWLSETAAIKNPFYGKQMLTCGQTVATLPPAEK